MVDQPLLRAVDLTRTFGVGSDAVTILRGVGLEMASGQTLAIMGPSGSGKSTLLHILGTLQRPSSGSVELAGQDPFALKPRQLASFRNRTIGFVFQDHHLLPQCSVMENVLIPTLASRQSAGAADKRAHHLLDRVGLTSRLDHRPSQLSGGERQRTAIARALINQPLLLLADEPTGNLDRRSAGQVGDLFHEICDEQSVTLIVVTHNLQLAERFDHRFELIDGTIQPLGALAPG